ncbi:MAG: two component transcriptional regulator, LuxR family [Verrucomicrobiales bacterium]|nr:two component transcriptional regulator, LuxR family [Verrucomicrobiales bacterium]
MAKKKILIIEDQAPMRRNVALMLELEGYLTCTAENGLIGVDTARRERPDLILCDVMMPEMDGYAVVQTLRDDPAFANTPFIFLTAKSDRGDVRIGMNFGADDYLTKPVMREDLLIAVGTRLARAQVLQERIASSSGFHPDFTSPDPLQRAFGLTPREAEVLLWVTQGKSNSDVATILGMSEKTAKQHLGICFQKMGVESRNAASMQALEVLGRR